MHSRMHTQYSDRQFKGEGEGGQKQRNKLGEGDLGVREQGKRKRGQKGG